MVHSNSCASVYKKAGQPSGLYFLRLVAVCAALLTVLDCQAALAENEGRDGGKDQGPLAAKPPLSFPHLTTLDGKSYVEVVVQKIEPDGLLVAFTPVEGGVGAAKVKFRNLPGAVAEQYGYDAVKAKDFESQMAQGETRWKAENVVWEARKEAAEQAAQERRLKQEEQLALRVSTQEARAEEGSREPQGAPYPGGYWWTENFGTRHSRSRSRGVSTPEVSPVPPSMQPMRPWIAPMKPLGR
jgi:hypothetical protein